MKRTWIIAAAIVLGVPAWGQTSRKSTTNPPPPPVRMKKQAPLPTPAKAGIAVGDSGCPECEVTPKPKQTR